MKLKPGDIVYSRTTSRRQVWEIAEDGRYSVINVPFFSQQERFLVVKSFYPMVGHSSWIKLNMLEVYSFKRAKTYYFRPFNLITQQLRELVNPINK